MCRPTVRWQQYKQHTRANTLPDIRCNGLTQEIGAMHSKLSHHGTGCTHTCITLSGVQCRRHTNPNCDGDYSTATSNSQHNHGRASCRTQPAEHNMQAFKLGNRTSVGSLTGQCFTVRSPSWQHNTTTWHSLHPVSAITGPTALGGLVTTPRWPLGGCPGSQHHDRPFCAHHGWQSAY